MKARCFEITLVEGLEAAFGHSEMISRVLCSLIVAPQALSPQSSSLAPNHLITHSGLSSCEFCSILVLNIPNSGINMPKLARIAMDKQGLVSIFSR